MIKYFLSIFFFFVSACCFGNSESTPNMSDSSHPIEQIEDTTHDTSLPSYKQSLVRMGLSLAGLLVLLVLTIWVYKKLTGGKFSGIHASKRIRVIERRPISAKSILYLIECDGKKILVAESQFEMRTLSNLDETFPQDT